jgi:hypothetical protein
MLSEEQASNPWGAYAGPEPPRQTVALPSYERALYDLAYGEAIGPSLGLAGFGSRNPVFNPPPGYIGRLGGASTDQFISGTFPLGDYRVGFIRIWTMSPTNQTLAFTQFQNEIAYFNQNTRGLVIDVMHNGGGNLCYVETLNRMLASRPFRGIAYEIRATEFWTQYFSSNLTAAKRANADQWIIDLYTVYLDQVQKARAELRGSTGDLPICGPTFQDIAPLPGAYTRPIMVLVNEFSLSAAESFPAMLQDQGRATIFGTRIAGGGGNPASYNAGTYSMGMTRATRSFFTRASWVSTPGFPAANHLENTGVYPDLWQDYMTEANLRTAGRDFVSAFTAALADIIAHNP